MVAEEEATIAAFEQLYQAGHAIYTAAFHEVSGLRPSPPSHAEPRFLVPLPNDWLLEITSGEDGPPYPPDHAHGKRLIFWLTTPDGLYAEEDARRFDWYEDRIPHLASAHACRLLWRNIDDIVADDPRRKYRRGLPRAHAPKIKALVERGDFVQPDLTPQPDGV